MVFTAIYTMQYTMIYRVIYAFVYTESYLDSLLNCHSWDITCMAIGRSLYGTMQSNAGIVDWN
jgi:hypothetical protein